MPISHNGSVNGFFGEQIRRLRTQKGLSQRDLARLVGLSQAQISLHERGADLPGPAIRAGYARALGITPEELEDLIHRSQLKEFLRASTSLSEESKRSIEDYVDFAFERDRRAREAEGRGRDGEYSEGPSDEGGLP